MTAKLLGMGLISAGCLAGAGIGGYLTLRPDVAEIAPLTVPAEVPATQPLAVPEPTPVQNAAVQSAAPVRPRATPARPFVTPAPPAVAVETPSAAPAPTPPAVDPVAAPPVAANAAPPVVEPPRYVPDPPPPVAATSLPEPSVVERLELTVEKHSVIGIRLDGAVSTRTARVEDRVTATVSRDVTVGGRIAIPAGVRLEGTVVLVERGGKFRTRPRLGLRFDRMILNDGTRVALKTDTIIHDGDSPTPDATAKVGAGAVAGAILGGLLGGKKGAALGTAAGAAGGAATVVRGDGNESSLPAGAPLTVRLTDDVIVTVQR